MFLFVDSYNFKATLQDNTDSIIVTCFSPQANSLLLPVTEVLSYMADPDPYTLPAIIRDLENTTHIFTIHIAPGSRRGNTSFILDHAADIPQVPVANVPTPVQEPCSSTTITQHSPEHVATEIPTAQITPPPHTDDPNEKKQYNSEGVSKTVTKKLFSQAINKEVTLQITETQATTQDEGTSTPPEEEPICEQEDTTTTQATKKTKHE